MVAQVQFTRADEIVAFLNSRDVRSFGTHADAVRDEFATPQSLKRWLVARDRLKQRDSVSAADHRTALRLRDGLRELLLTGHYEAVDVVASRLSFSVTFHEGEPRVIPDGSGVRAYLAELVAACALAEADGNWPLIKMCAAEDCRWAFVDGSRNRMARWCATDVCGNRVKTRRYRERLRVASQ